MWLGPKIIGKQAFERQEEAKKTGAAVYGPKVTGPFVPRAQVSGRPDVELDADADAPAASSDELAAAQAEIARLKAEVAAATAAPQAPQAPEGADGDEGADDEEPGIGYLTVEEVTEALRENPALFDRLVELEFDRKRGPRKTACAVFLEHELAREGGAREAVVDRLTPYAG